MKPRTIPLLTTHISHRTPQQLLAYVKGLHKKPENSSPVEGIKIVYGKKVTQVRFTREGKKRVTMTEIKLLSEFYKKPEAGILELMKKRKVDII